MSNGLDAVEQCQQQTFDLVFLDEMMPGMSGLETLQRIKDIQPQTPVVMVTKSEEEDIMDQAIGKKIADYLIKPVNPMQILLSLKKNIHSREIVTEVTQTGYQQNFQNISMKISDCRSIDDWKEVQTYGNTSAFSVSRLVKPCIKNNGFDPFSALAKNLTMSSRPSKSRRDDGH